jgi:hypothetical protein
MGANLSLSNLSSANGSGTGRYCSFGSFKEAAFNLVQNSEQARNLETVASPLTRLQKGHYDIAIYTDF